MADISNTAQLFCGFSETQLKDMNRNVIEEALLGDSLWNSPRCVSTQTQVATPFWPNTGSPTSSTKAGTVSDAGLHYDHKFLRPKHANSEPFEPQKVSWDNIQNTSSNMDKSSDVERIAIVGMSCRFPGEATDIGKFWDVVSEARSTWSTVPESRWTAGSFYHPNHENTDTVSQLYLSLCDGAY